MTRNEIARATSAVLLGRCTELEDRAETLAYFDGVWTAADLAEEAAIETELRWIEREQEARHFANHADARVRQGMGAES